MWSICPPGSGYPYVLEAPAQDYISGKHATKKTKKTKTHLNYHYCYYYCYYYYCYPQSAPSTTTHQFSHPSTPATANPAAVTTPIINLLISGH